MKTSIDISALPLMDSINAFFGLAAAILSYIFGAEWYLFVFFFILNVIDYITGIMKAKLKGVENSTKGLEGVAKKLGYWIMIAVGFIVSSVFIHLGHTIGIDLKFAICIGWFVLASLMINELRSIIENFIEAGYKVPTILSKGIEAAEKAVDQASDKVFGDDDEEEDE